MLTTLPRAFTLATVMAFAAAAPTEAQSTRNGIVTIPIGAESRAADEGLKERAKSIRESGMTLVDAIRKAEAAAGGPALFANVPGKKEVKTPKRNAKREKFRIQTYCFAGGKVQRIRVTEDGAKKMDEADAEGGPIDDPGAIAAALKGFPLADAVAAALKEKPGDAINAAAYKASNGRIMITVKIVAGDTLWTIDLDPATKKVAP